VNERQESCNFRIYAMYFSERDLFTQ